jgi:zinc transporter, ZIP family
MSLELALFYGFITGLPLVAGAIITKFFTFKEKPIGMIMAFGSGVLIAVVAFSLMSEAYEMGGIIPVSIGFVAGAALFSWGNHTVNKRGAKNRKRCYGPKVGGGKASGTALALGSLMDNIPESFAIGVSLLSSGSVSNALLVGIMISNFPESSAGAQAMKITGRSQKYIFKTWGGIAVINIIAAAIGFIVISHLGLEIQAITLGIAGGAILAMLAETMMPEAYESGAYHVSLATVAGFLIAFILGLEHL